MSRLESSDRLEKMVKSLISKHHKQLKNVQFGCAMKSYDPDSPIRGRTPKPGKEPKIIELKKISELFQFFGCPEVIIIVQERFWDKMEISQHEAMLDNALAQIVKDEDGIYFKSATFLDAGVLERRGAFTDRIREIFAVAQQMNLPMGQPDELEQPVTH